MTLSATLYCPSAPSHGAARKWVHNRNVHVLLIDEDVLDARGQSSIGNICSPAIVECHTIATEVDSRYDGPRSAYGRAIRAAEALEASLTAALELTEQLELLAA